MTSCLEYFSLFPESQHCSSLTNHIKREDLEGPVVKKKKNQCKHPIYTFKIIRKKVMFTSLILYFVPFPPFLHAQLFPPSAIQSAFLTTDYHLFCSLSITSLSALSFLLPTNLQRILWSSTMGQLRIATWSRVSTASTRCSTSLSVWVTWSRPRGTRPWPALSSSVG